MAERRRNPRYKKRLPVVFDDGKQSRIGFSINFSKGGISIGAAHTLSPGTEIRGKFTTREGKDLEFDAVVQWSQQIRGMAGIAAQNTMGLLLRNISDVAYEAFLDTLVKGRAPEDPYVAGTTGSRPTEPPHAGAGMRFPVGLRGQTVFFLGGEDFAVAPSRGRPRLLLGRVAQWFEIAVQKAVAPQLRDGEFGNGERLDVLHRDGIDVDVGTKVEVFAQLQSAEAEERLVFDVGVLIAGADIARGQYLWLLRK